MKNNWNARLYEDKHAFVWEYGSDLIEILEPKPEERILDLGCGTGQLTDRIAKSCREAIGIDKSAQMVERATQNYPNLQFIVADATNFTFKEQFDGIFSNAALHWIKPPETAIECMWQALKPGGRLVAEFGGKGNVEQILSAISEVIKENNYQINQEINPWYFPSIGEYSSLLEKRGFEVNYAILFPRMTPLEGGKEGIKNWLKMFAGGIINNIKKESQAAAIAAIVNKLTVTLPQLEKTNLGENNTWLADYKRIRIVAKKENY